MSWHAQNWPSPTARGGRRAFLHVIRVNSSEEHAAPLTAFHGRLPAALECRTASKDDKEEYRMCSPQVRKGPRQLQSHLGFSRPSAWSASSFGSRARAPRQPRSKPSGRLRLQVEPGIGRMLCMHRPPFLSVQSVARCERFQRRCEHNLSDRRHSACTGEPPGEKSLVGQAGAIR